MRCVWIWKSSATTAAAQLCRGQPAGHLVFRRRLMSPERREAMHEFLGSAGWGAAALSPLPGDASTRHYIRLRMNGRGAMLMDQPQNAEAPQCPPGASADERRALGYNAVARLAGA